MVTFRVMPTGPEVDLHPVESSLRAAFGEDLRDMVERPVAFGLTGLEVVVLLEDAEGRLEAAEATLRGMEGVGSVEALSLDLV